MLFIKKIIGLLDLLIPKKNMSVFIANKSDVSNNIEFYNYLLYKNKYKVFWIATNKYLVKKNQFYLYSFKGLWLVLRSKNLFLCHDSLTFLKSNHRNIFNFWHGIGLKKMGFLINENYKSNNLKKYFFFLCSNIDQMEFSSAFGLNPNQIKITGLPRNDKLFNTELQKANLKKLNNFLKINIKFKKIFFYLPTFRENVRKNKNKNKNFFLFDDFNYDKLVSTLKKNNVLLFVRLHPYEDRHFKKFTNSYNIFNINDSLLNKINLDIYDFLGSVDCLITDYSSVAFDYMLLDKPIISVIPDIKIYSSDRGLLLEPFNFWLPGKIISTFDSFLSLLSKDYIYNDEDWKKHKLMKSIRHKYQDNKSCERIYNIIKNDIK